MKYIFVLGAGQMGAGIAQVFATHNFSVKLFDVNEEALKKGIEGIYKRLDRSVEKERMSQEEAEQAKAHLETASTMEDAAECDFAIEAVVESMDIKEKVFRQLDDIMPEHAILATNTSSLPITDIAAATNRPSQVIGMHFMNPVPVMKLVEVIRAIQTSDDTYERVEQLAQQLVKTPVEVNDYPGFVSNRVLMPMINEAVFTVYEGVASKEDVDTVMKLGMNHPMGPLELADFIGLDTCLSIMEILYDGFGDSKYRPCPLLKKYVAAGWLGKKSGRGFYVYE
ncbi:3-hydroxybutyryl-CoA dehydrogenase [Salimicrobium flavidum]|uniref:3-hydroxybutyryl-CoA dehydrogenase n=1 Tax=Salimicrobium flavidum TaxID=570947 RepID=A0A1N7IVJ0_9BACI|nr:3-hydroxybutyryl-CoA dehydrogenase [Salimicrobium flavidum]SIS41064.1 3-hydroxybutyryl-CoA dehydrogenase [Salimicrobium flavidum]